jgi:hypothetical protein
MASTVDSSTINNNNNNKKQSNFRHLQYLEEK